MNWEEYQTRAARTLSRLPLSKLTDQEFQTKTAVMGLGIAGESGEVADLIKKWVGHGHDVDLSKLNKELGDVLWYVAALCTLYGLDLEEVAATNIAKLEARYPNGFSTEASLARVDEKAGGA